MRSSTPGRWEEVTLYSHGDSRLLSTWSNVPYFFGETLERKGIKVNRVDVGARPLFQRLYQGSVFKLLRRLSPDTTHDYVRSWFHFADVRRRVRRAVAAYPNAQAHIFTTFSYSAAGMTDKPTMLFCDWTYDYYFRYFKERAPDRWEQRCIAREDRQIEESTLILPLFPAVADYMRARYRNPNIHYLGNVINALETPERAEVLACKSQSQRLLFVGSANYLEGAEQLIRAFELLKPHYPALTLEIVGLTTRYFGALPADVNCHGYLDKGITEQRARYYGLLRDAKMFINTTPKWGAFSGTVEAMYFYTPVVVTPYLEFVRTFGQDLDCGGYCAAMSPDELASSIRAILDAPGYPELAQRAHNAVRDFTWSAYVDKALAQLAGVCSGQPSYRVPAGAVE